ncbi:chloride channel protein [Thalassolituus sp.]|uniref:chloride channel protein n=1 Tax=Thalassolituus sp. TaxID=2030822 RepID=UPI002E8495E7|nr:chloride channel protein [Pseudomonadota bacterium]MEC8104179.1 chloride channel protein [Pseudomonadota bacterium]MEC8524947.1 chloride channel protein [Pseudomonadota bacterium]MEE2748380.1 chloride channel protein [Pseudomonadota bacterium]
MTPLRQLWQNMITLSDNQIGLAGLALLTGLVSAGLITLFRLAIELPLVSFFPIESAENFEAMSRETRSLLLLGGGALLILMFYWLPQERRSVGVAHVLLRMERHQGYLPARNIILQWFAAVVALLSGHSVGREGPAIHLGAGTGSQIGQRTELAHHRLRILAAAGVASAISASFNTPMAGVIFAMEVVLLEYSIRGFIPIILASVSGAIVSRAVFGHETAFNVPALNMHSLWEVPYILLLGVVCGLVATAYIYMVKAFQRIGHLPLVLRWGGLTLTTLAVSWWLPQILGIGYDTVNDALNGQVFFITLLLLLGAKMLLSSWAAAVSFPAGLIGPVMFIGAAVGGLMGQLSIWLAPDYPVSIGFYTMLGMGAMMGAVLRAPLAALVALLELTANPNIIMPGMLSVVIASLVVSEVFRLPSVFQVQLGGNVQYQTPSPVRQMLRNTWVAQAMQGSVIEAQRTLSREAAGFILQRDPDWLLIANEDTLIRPAAVAEALETQTEADTVDLLTIPADRQAAGRISLKANLQDALDLMQAHQLQWLIVYRDERRHQFAGVVSRDDIERYYQYRPA